MEDIAAVSFEAASTSRWGEAASFFEIKDQPKERRPEIVGRIPASRLEGREFNKDRRANILLE